jgi:hypothetical protein
MDPTRDEPEESMTELDVGPIDYIALEFPQAKVTGEGMEILLGLVDRGIIRILDMRVVLRDADGTYKGIAVADLNADGALDLAIFQGIESGLLDDDDVRAAAELIEPGNAVGLLVYENTWAGPFVTAMRKVGAEVVASGRIPADDVIAALDSLESAS